MTFAYAWRLVLRNPRPTATYLFGLALAVGLFAGILFFVDATARQMTGTAIAAVQLDLVVRATTPDMDLPAVAEQLAGQRGILAVEPMTVADFTSAVKVGGTEHSPAGRLFAVNPSYFQTFDVAQVTQGRLNPTGVMVGEEMAIALDLQLGDTIQLTFAGLDQPVVLPITGIVNMSNADALFSTATEAENAVVANVAFVDSGWFVAHLQPQLAPLMANPPAALPIGSILLDQQAHVRIDRSLLPAYPIRAAQFTAALRRELERQFPGRLKATDNLSGAFRNARSDVLAAKILFIFLGLPGVALAAYLAKFAAELFSEAQRRELSLLRTRGASPSQMAAMIAVTSVFLAMGGSALGLLLGLLLLQVSARTQMTGLLNPFAPGFDWGLFRNSAGLAFLAGLLLTFLAAFLPSIGALRREVTQDRRTARRAETAPFWKRMYLDVILLAASVIVLVVMQLNGGFKPSANEAVTVQLSFYIFLAPFFAWIGLILLTLRLVEAGLKAAPAPLAAGFRRLFGEIGEVAGKSVARRARRISAATAVIALTLSFGVSLVLFERTYATEKQLDAQYVVGSDIRFTPALNTPQTADFADQLRVPGVTGVTGVARDTRVLIGSEKDVVYGIDAASFRQVAYLPDSFFVDGAAQQTIDALTNHTTRYAPGSARQVLDALASTPDGVIISVERAEMYNILVGDPLLMRLYDRATNTYVDVTTKVVGMFVYFPTSAYDSDFVLNRDFMIGSSGNSSMDFFLLETNGQPQTIAQVSDKLAAQYRNVMPVRMQSTQTVIKIEESSLTSLNIGGLGTMELVYTVLVTSVGLAIFLLAMINERQREFGAMRALGANLGRLRRFLFTEAFTIGGLSLVVGAGVGILLARMLVMLLGVIFTIPARGLAWPGLELLTLGGFVIVGMVGSVLISARRLSTLRVVEALREL